MALDLAADLASMYSTAEFAIAARYVYTGKGGPGIDVSVILDRPDDAVGLATLGAVSRQRTLRIRASELELRPERGDTVVLPASGAAPEEIVTVRGSRLGLDGTEWFLDVSP